MKQVEEVTPDTSEMIQVEGGVGVAVYEARTQKQFGCGDMLTMPLRMKPPEVYRTPGAFDYAGYLLEQGIAAHGNVSADRIVLVAREKGGWRCRFYAARSWAAGRLAEYAGSGPNARLPRVLWLSEADVQMLNAMLFGERTGLNHAMRTGFERTGTFHLFVVSGLHIALVAAGLYWVLRRLHAPAWVATVVTLPLITMYAAMTGMGQPAQRALAMTAVFLVARLLSRDRDTLNALGAAVLALLIVSPSSLFEASFQMTALVIVAIAGIAAPMANWTAIRFAGVTKMVFERRRRVAEPRAAQTVLMLEVWGEALADLLPKGWRKRARKLPAWGLRWTLRFAELSLISLVAELVMALPMAVYFHRLTVFSIPANVLILPLVGLLVPAALLTFVLSLLGAKMALLPAAATALLLHGVSWVVLRLGGLQHGDVRIPAPVWWVGIAALAGWLGCCWMVRRGRWTGIGAACALPMIWACVVWPEAAHVTRGSLEVTALDVGQGDSILVVNPQGETMLVDAGGPVGSHSAAEAVSSFDVGEEVVAPYLWSRRIRTVDVLVLTHAHTDHMGGMPAILRDFRPRELWVGIDPVSPLYVSLLHEAGKLKIPVRHVHAGDGMQWGPVSVRVLAPAVGYGNMGAPKNDDSVVMELQYGQASVLLEGDAERPSEDAMLAAKRVHPVTLLKVGHHGSKTSTNPEFLAEARPREAVISVGRQNTFGHPRAEVIERLAEAHTRLFRTDDMGLTTFLLSEDGEVRTMVGGEAKLLPEPTGPGALH